MRKMHPTTFTLNSLFRPFLLLFILFSGYLGNAQPLSGILPKFGSTVPQSIVDFQWNSKTGTVDYVVILAQDASFSIGLIQSPALTVTSWQSTSLSSGLWYWKVQANDGSLISESGTNIFRIFKPNDISNNTLWLAGDGNFQMSGSNVLQWTDMSGLGNNFGQVTPSDQPIVTNVSLLNNKPAVRFDGASDYLNAGNVLNIGTNSITAFVLSSGLGSIYSKFGSGTAPLNIFSCYNLPSEQGVELAGNSYQNFFTSVASNYHFLSFRANRATANAQMKRNLTLVSSGTITGIVPISSYNFSNANPFLMGRYAMTGSPFFLNGDIAEVIFYNRSLTDVERTQVENYLSDKYAPPVNLGKDSTLTNFCPFTINAPAGYTNLLWSTGETTPSISVSNPGPYWLRGTNLFGVISRDTMMVNHPNIPPPLNNFICLNGTHTWNADMGPGFTYLWSTGATTPSLDITSPGTYSVVVTDGFGCTRNSGDYTFFIDNYSQTAFLGNDTLLCTGNQIALQIGAAETEAYFWNGVSSADQLPFWVVDTTGNYFLESMNINGCVAQDTIHITIAGTAPTANFTVNDVCDLTAAVFTDNSFTPDLSPVDEWLWTFGDGEQSTVQNPQHIFVGGAGTYNVQLYVAQGGCGAYYTLPVEVFELPQADFTMSGFCDGDASFFIDQSVQGTAGINGWLWNFGQPSSGLNNTSVQQSPSKLYGETGTFNVTLQVTDANNCMDELVQSITINSSPVSEFTASDICAGSNISFTNTSSAPSPDFIQNYLWNFGDNTFSILPIPGKTFTEPGYKTISLIVTSSNGCYTQSQEQMFVHSIPVPQINTGPACVGTYTAFTDVSQVYTGFVASSSWEIDLGSAISGSPINYVFNTPGSHNVELVTTSDFGCVGDTMIVIEVNSMLNAAFSLSSSVVIVGEPVEFVNSSVGANSYSWTFGDGNGSSDTNPIYYYDSQWIDSTLTVSLYVENSFGCKDTASLDVLVRKARFDLEMNNVYVSEENGFYTVGVALKNVGTAMIEYTDVELRLSNGVLMQERFEDTIFSGQTKIKVFTSKPSAFVSTQDGVDAWICAEGSPYSSLQLADEDWSNNEFCKNIEGTLPVLIGPNPNPATDQFSFTVLISTESVISVELFDSKGRIVKRFYEDATLQKGMYNFTVPLEGMGSGVYMLRMNDEVKRVVVE